MRNVDCTFLLAAAHTRTVRDRSMRIDNGRIAAIGKRKPGNGRSTLVMPALVNAHDHARAVRSSSFGAGGKPLETWLHYMAMLPAVDPYLATAVSLAHSALGGAGTVMVHYTRVQGLTDLVTEAQQVARAAGDVGVRVGFAVALRDINPLVYGPSQSIVNALPPAARAEVERRFLKPPLPIADMMATVDAVASSCDQPEFNVQYGPTGVQWCSPGLLAAVAEASARTGRRVHMHLLETRYQRDWADKNYPQGIVTYLDEIGLLSPRLTLAHCTWARPAELAIIAARGATIAVNTSSNLGIRSGIAPVAEMLRQGCRVALGLDGLALDEDDDALRELRLGYLLHRGTGFDVDVDAGAMLAMAFANGHLSVLNANEGGELTAGAPADLLVLDWDRLDDDRLYADLDPLDLLFSRASAGHIDELIVAGKPVVHQGRVPGIDLPAMRVELLGRFRAGIKQNAALAETLGLLARHIAEHFNAECGCR
jgi:cytosine/adenosine deaminase-related metal-dependent hydrolase